MVGKTDAEYYAARLRTEREAVAQSSCKAARAAHQALADHYAMWLGEFREEEEEAHSQEPRLFMLAPIASSASRA